MTFVIFNNKKLQMDSVNYLINYCVDRNSKPIDLFYDKLGYFDYYDFHKKVHSMKISLMWEISFDF